MSDINVLGTDLERDPGIETAILISLFTDKRAEDQDTLPDNSGDKRGWWADSDNRRIGSKLWLLNRSSLTPDVPALVEQYIKDSLQWMIEDRVAKDFVIDVTRLDMHTLSINIGFVQPNGQENFFKYSYNWNAELLKRR